MIIEGDENSEKGKEPEADPSLKTSLTDLGQAFDKPAAPAASATSQSNQTSQNKGNTMSHMNQLAALFSQSNLAAAHTTVPEMDDIIKTIKERVKALRSNTGTEVQKAALPTDIRTLTSSISPTLPGIAMYTVLGNECWVMPVLFYKDGITDVTDTIQFMNEAPRGIAKVPSSFMSGDLASKVKQSFAVINEKQMSTVIIINPRVFILERYIKAGHTGEDLVRLASSDLLQDFTTGMLSLFALRFVKEEGTLPDPFTNRKLFGEHGAAMARVEAIQGVEPGQVVHPNNLCVKLVTTNKAGNQYNPNQTSKSIITTPLNVQLATMSRDQFNSARIARPGVAGVGPLVPIVSISNSIPGETLGNNCSVFSVILGLYAALAANHQAVLAEAYRGKEVGNRGNLSNFNAMLGQYLGPQGYDASCMLTDKNIMNIEAVSNWIRTYVSSAPIYVVDAPAYLDNASTSEFYFGLAEKDSTSAYYRAAVAAANALSNGKFSQLVEQNRLDNQRDKSKQWVIGDHILFQTNTLRPYGQAVNPRTQKYFDLGEIDDMLLRQKEFFGENEMAVAEYQSLIQGSSQITDARQRQYHITARLQQLVGNTARIEGWAQRFTVSPAFANTFTKAMEGAGSLTVSSNNYGGQFVSCIDNSMLNHLMTAVIQQTQASHVFGGSNMFTQY